MILKQHQIIYNHFVLITDKQHSFRISIVASFQQFISIRLIIGCGGVTDGSKLQRRERHILPAVNNAVGTERYIGV